MQNKKINYIKFGIITAIIFIIVVALIEFLFALNSQTVEEITSNMLTPKYIISKLIVGAIYGSIMVFWMKRKNKKISK
jgi:hypothetical protein